MSDETDLNISAIYLNAVRNVQKNQNIVDTEKVSICIGTAESVMCDVISIRKKEGVSG